MTQQHWHQRGYRSITGGELVRVGSRIVGADVDVGEIGVALERWYEGDQNASPAWRLNKEIMVRCLFGSREVSLPENCLEVEAVSKWRV